MRLCDMGFAWMQLYKNEVYVFVCAHKVVFSKVHLESGLKSYKSHKDRTDLLPL